MSDAAISASLHAATRRTQRMRAVPAGGVERIAQAFSEHGRRAALMPYLMGGYPTPWTSRCGSAKPACSAGADLLELGMPYSDPLADGPVIHAAGTQALAAGANVAGVLEVARGLAASVPVVLMCYANMVLRAGRRRLRGAARADGRVRADRAGPAAGGVRGDPGRMRRARAGARAAGCAHDARPSGWRRSGRRRGGFCTRSRSSAPPGSAPRCPSASGRSSRAAKASTEVPVALGFGIGTPEQARTAADAGADGVIVGTRLVRAAGEAPEDPAGAVGAVVAELAAGLALSSTTAEPAPAAGRQVAPGPVRACLR